MRPSVIMYGAPPSGYDPSRYNQPVHYQPAYYQPAYYPYPYYGQPMVNPYEAARQAEGADRIASLIWKLVLVVIVCAVGGAIAFFIIIS